MTTTTRPTTAIKLLACYDLRNIDPVTGEKQPLEEGQGCTCERCGKTHAVVYQVAEFKRDGAGRLFPVAGSTREVGSTCFRKLFNQTPTSMGWGCGMHEFQGKNARNMLARTRS